jgi:hypothetical protein
MSDEERDARWQDIVDARIDFADGEPTELRAVGGNGARRRTSSKSEQFNEALSGLTSWSTVESSRRRLSA